MKDVQVEYYEMNGQRKMCKCCEKEPLTSLETGLCEECFSRKMKESIEVAELKELWAFENNWNAKYYQPWPDFPNPPRDCLWLEDEMDYRYLDLNVRCVMCGETKTGREMAIWSRHLAECKACFSDKLNSIQGDK